MNEEKIIQKLLEQDDKFEKIGKKIDDGFGNVTGTLEGIATIVKRLDQKRLFSASFLISSLKAGIFNELTDS